MKTLYTLIFLLLALNSFGQTAYTQNLYSYSVESNIEYGTATNYAGLTEALHLDIYKPINDNNCNRPCLVLIHGGAWVQGSKDGTLILNLAEKFVKKGWVVAAINYRLGTHGPNVYDDENHPTCALFGDTVNIFRCWNTTDSAEVLRANYRAQQDAKGAIRYVKGRHLLDSTDVSNFYVLGESAGAFVALATTFMNSPSEKPIECGSLANAPVPDSYLVDCLPSGYLLDRPDLGDVEGLISLNNGYDASVQGVGSFFGGTFGTDLFNNTTTWPSIYLFHQEKDLIVSSEHLPPLSRLNTCLGLTNDCPPFATFPYAHGSNSINSFLISQTTPPNIHFDFLANSNGLPGDCLSASGHAIDNVNLRTQNIANHFAQRIFDNGNVPSSTCTNSTSEKSMNAPRIFPNPSSGKVSIELNPDFHTQLSILTSDGKIVSTFDAQTIQTIQLKEGVYFFHTVAENGQRWTKKIVIL